MMEKNDTSQLPAQPYDVSLAERDFVETAVLNDILDTSLNKYHGLFEATPISLWEEDFTQVKQFIDELKQAGVTDFRAYFDDHPQDVAHCIGLVRVVNVNQTTLKLYHADSKEELLANLETVLGPEAFHVFKEELILIGNGETLFESEGVNYTLDGDRLDVFVRWSVTPGYEDSLTQVIVSITDITKRKQAELSIREAKEYAEQLFQVVPSAVLTVDENQRITSWNQKATELLGYTPEEMIGQHCRKFTISPCNKTCGLFNEGIDKSINGAECQVRTKDGRILTVVKNADLLRDAAGRIIGGIESFEDITERKRTEDQLSESLSLLQATLESTADGILVVDPKGNVTRYNHRFLEMWRIPDAIAAMEDDAKLIAFVLDQLVEPDQFIAQIHELYSQPEAESFDVLTFKDGRVFERLSKPQRVNDRIVGRVWSFRDVTSQRQAEQTLRLTQFSIDKVPQSIFWIGPEAHILNANEGASRMLGYSHEELRQLTVFDFDPLFPREAFRPLWDDLRQHRSMVIESEHQTKNGRCYPVEISLNFLEYEDQEYLFAFATDITERKQMETQLRQQLKKEEMLRQVAALMSTKSDLNTVLTAVCQKAAQYYRASHAAFAYLDERGVYADVIVEYLDPTVDDSQQIISVINIAPLADLMALKEPTTLTNVRQAPLLEPVHDIISEFDTVSALLIPILIDGQIIGMLEFDWLVPQAVEEQEVAFNEKIAAQISQAIHRQRAEQALQEQRDFAQQVMGNMGQGLLVVRKDWTIEYCNPAFADLLGYEPEAMIGRSALNMVYKVDPRTVKAVTARWQNGETQEREIPFQHANGRPVHVLMTGVPRWHDGQIDGAIAVITDLTKRKEVEKELASARDRALEASRLKSEFLANMSHEIRTPLNAVIGMTSLLLDTSLNDQQQDFAETIRSSGDVLLALINDILDFSKIEAGKLELEKRPFDLRDCVEEALDVVVSKAAEKGLEVAYIMEEHVPQTIVGDAIRLRQVMVNLLNNAIKFTDVGEVVLRISPYHTAHTPTAPNRQLLHFSVRDTGIGIPEEKRDRLFQSFSQVDASTTRKYGGTGLGLAISKRLVEMMGGSIWVESKVNHGSTFHFTIETEERSLRRRVYLRGTQPLLMKKRLLIVDDNETNRRILTKQAASWGMDSHAVASGMEALAILRAGQHYDAAILDMHMPQMDGLTLAKQIRQLRSEKMMPLVMLSSIGNSNEVREKALFATYLTKPIKPKQLFTTLTNLFGETAVTISQAPAKREIDPDMGRNHPLRILLAEDNLVNQKVALRILERMGYQADVAANGLEVLEALQHKLYDVVLMDVQMPNMDGVEATQQIREIWPPQQQPTIIAMTANALTGDREKYLNAGMDKYISKPVRIQELMDALANSHPLSNG